MPTPPLSRGVSAEPPSSSNDECESITIDDKVQLLDELLERYLYLLDRHQKLQESLGKQLSSVWKNPIPNFWGKRISEVLCLI